MHVVCSDADVWRYNRGCASQELVDLFDVPSGGGCFDQYDLDSGEINSNYVVRNYVFIANNHGGGGVWQCVSDTVNP